VISSAQIDDLYYCMTGNIDHDRLFKQLLSTFFLEFLDLFAPELAVYINPDSLEFLPQEYFTDLDQGERKAMDLIVRVSLRRRPNEPEVGKVSIIINCEHQSSSETNFNRRLFFYFAQLHRQYLEPIYPIAIFSFDKLKHKQEQDKYQVKLPGLDVLQFNFLKIQLNQLNWRDFLKQKNPVAAALMAKMKIEPQDRARVKVECLRMVATLKLDAARVFVLSGFVDSYLKLNLVEEMEFQTEVANIKKESQKERVMEIVTSWMERGIEQGIEQGIERGGKQEALRLVSRVLTKRVGELDAMLNQRLQDLSISQLEDLHDAALDFTQVNQLMSWLTTNG
jgi:predicted transposase/invertase (TIGR01784 family)